MAEKQHDTRNSGFLFGFLLGMAAALLLVTKKGRKILRAITDHGMEKLGDWENIVRDALPADDDYIDGDDYVVSPSTVKPLRDDQPSVEKEITEEKATTATHDERTHEALRTTENVQTPDTGTVTKVKSATRRLFKGIKKRS